MLYPVRIYMYVNMHYLQSTLQIELFWLLLKKELVTKYPQKSLIKKYSRGDHSKKYTSDLLRYTDYTKTHRGKRIISPNFIYRGNTPHDEVSLHLHIYLCS